MKRTPKYSFGAAAIMALAVAAPAMAESVEDVYKGRNVTILVGYGAGGSYGQTAQLISQHFGKYIPGAPNVIVQHMPGAGGIKAANYAYNVMPKNGTFILMPPEMTVVSQLLRPTKVKYVTGKFTFIGTVFGSNQVMMIRRDTGIKSLEELTKKEVVVASSGAGSPTYLIPAMMNGILKTKFKIVTGYKGSAGTTLSVEQGETFGMTNSWVSWNMSHADWFKGQDNDFALKLAQVGFTKEPDLPNIPLLHEIATTDDDRAAAAMLSTASVIGRGLAFPPEVPKNLIAPMRTAFWNTVNDAAFKKDAEKRQIPVVPLKGADLQKTLDDAMKTMSPSAIAKAQSYVFGKKGGKGKK